MKCKIFLSALLIFNLSISSAEDSLASEEVEKCQYPEKPKIISENLNSEKELSIVEEKIKIYLQTGYQYLECIAMVEKSWGDTVTAEQKKLIIMIHNNVVDEMNAIASEFNSIVRNFKSNKK